MHNLKTPASLALALYLAIAGCGNRGEDQQPIPTSPVQPGYSAPPSDPYNQTQYPTPGSAPATPSATPRPVPSVPVVNPSPGASASPAPSTNPSTAPSPSPSPSASPPPVSADYKLRIVDVKKSTSGIWLWKKAELTVQVQNPLLTRVQTGKVIVTYFYDGSIVGQPLSNGVSLQPAEIKTFTFKATQKSDDANAQVTTDGQ